MTTPKSLGQELSFAHIGNATIMESLYEQYRTDSASVDLSWQIFFKGYEMAILAGGERLSHRCAVCARVRLGAEIQSYINLFRRVGHLSAYIDPLGTKPALIPELETAGTALADIEPTETFQPTRLPFDRPVTFGEIQSLLQDTYTRSIGADFMDSTTVEEVRWLEEMMEGCRNRPTLGGEKKRRILDKMIKAQGFERFLQDRYIGMKRFSLEGLESLIPLLDTIIDEGAGREVSQICLGMAHRGRLNVLANILDKPLQTMFFEFEDTELHESIDGDVHFHKGYAATAKTKTRPVDIYLAPNPSHLEAVNAVVEGFARAIQETKAAAGAKAVLPILIHGDAAFIGQGVVAETFNLANLQHYGTGGTIHLITNNQIGFTTTAKESRSFTYASDIAKMIRAPVFHVNADDPEAVVWTAVIAVAYRQMFHKDVVIDLIGYRKYGHNETDEPSFTQPLMYKKINHHKPAMEIYLKQLIAEQVTTEAETSQAIDLHRQNMGKIYDLVKSGSGPAEFNPPASLAAAFHYRPVERGELFAPVSTKIEPAMLTGLGQTITSLPAGFHLHPKMEKLLATRRAMLSGEGSLDWAMGELLTYASLGAEGHHVRLSGQDSGRGTFSHRHAVFHDQTTGEPWEPLKQKPWAPVDVINAPLSEEAVLGFEFGYAVARPDALVIWEAQFGDFCNGAQIVIDQFLAASEAKWHQTSSLTLFLPHGFEGQGPEHSSARPERFLTLCGQGNMQVANLTTPAQLFHMLRRQVLRPFRKPLVLLTPKSLLRHPQAVSPLADFTEGHFHEVLAEQQSHEPAQIEQVIFCTGKIYYELAAARARQPIRGVIIRIEQLYPFPEDQVKKLLAQYPNIKQILWVQEEPRNHGYWWFIRSQFTKIDDLACPIQFVGRPSAGTTAEGSRRNHTKEQERIVQDALAGIPTKQQR